MPPATPKLEKFRQAGKAYYDLYSNSGCNRIGEIRKIFGMGARTCWSSNSATAYAARAKVEGVMDKVVLEAAKEWIWQEFMSPTGDITQFPKRLPRPLGCCKARLDQGLKWPDK